MTAALVETKERPILFSAPMVLAILDGRKTQTRRVVKPQPASPAAMGRWSDGELRKLFGKAHCIWPADAVDEATGNRPDHYAVCPYGITGDRLWVRETWGKGWESGDGSYSALRPTGPQHERPDKIFYRADGWDESQGRYPWHPSIHMPRWASRITLEITGVRVEQLQAISESDAKAEGISVLPLQDANDPSAWWQSAPGKNQARTPQASFRLLWESINGDDSWAANPWVWAIEFKPVAK